MDSPLDRKLLGFRQIAQEKLQNIFCSIPGRKDLIIEPDLIKPLELICGVSWLRQRGVEKIYKFNEKGAPAPRDTGLVYFVHGHLPVLKLVLEQILSFGAHPILSLDVILYPSVPVQDMLEEEGLHGRVRLHRFAWDFVSLDAGVLTLEVPHVFREVFVAHDTALLAPIAHSLRLLSLITGRPKAVFTLGENAERVLGMVRRLQSASKTPASPTPADIPLWLVVDRDRDYPSALLTPVVYAALMAELFHATCGVLRVDSSAPNRIQAGRLAMLHPVDATKTVKTPAAVAGVRMSATFDSVYSDNRYRHFTDVVSRLSEQARTLGEEGRRSTNEMHGNVAEMREFVTQRLPRVAAAKRDLTRHLSLCETIVAEMGATFERRQAVEEAIIVGSNHRSALSAIDEQLATDAHRANTLRLAALLHVTQGLTADEGASIATTYCAAFGYAHLATFAALHAAGLFPEQPVAAHSPRAAALLANIPLARRLTSAVAFRDTADKLRLIPNARSPVCPSFVFGNAYVPLVAQLVTLLLATDATLEDCSAQLAALPNLRVDVAGQGPHTLRDAVAGVKRGDFADPLTARPRAIFVYVVGGITYAEVAACHLVERLTGARVIVAGDTIVTGADLMEACFE